MPTWGAVVFGVAASAFVAGVGVRFLLRETRIAVLMVAVVSAALGPLFWDLVLRHTGGRFFTDAPGVVFPVSYEDVGSGVWTMALAGLMLGFGPMHRDAGNRVAVVALACALAALLVDIYLY
jgi:hypothetical protein